MLSFATAFLFNIFNLFGLYRIFVRNDFSTLLESTLQTATNVYFVIYCLVIITLSSFLTQSGKGTSILCHKAINYSDDDSIVYHVCISLIEVSIDSVTFFSVQTVLAAIASSLAHCYLWSLHVRLYFAFHCNFLEFIKFN